ncbi:MAG: hypothetical protein ACR2MO_08515 [Acidimicrobiales bacterium]
MSGIAETKSMNTPVQATLTTPPSVEYVADGRGPAWEAGGPTEPGAGTTPTPAAGVVWVVVGGAAGATATPP